MWEPQWMAGCMGFVWVHPDSFLNCVNVNVNVNCVASPFHSFVTSGVCDTVVVPKGLVYPCQSPCDDIVEIFIRVYCTEKATEARHRLDRHLFSSVAIARPRICLLQDVYCKRAWVEL